MSEGKLCLTFAILRKFQPSSWNDGQVERLILGSLGEMGVIKLMVTG